MLVAQALISCNEDIELAGGDGKKGAILERGPAHLWNCPDLVLGEFSAESARNTLVKKQSHG